MQTERRINVDLAVIVDTGFDLNFSEGFRVAGEYLRTQDVPSRVVVRVINYAMRRVDANPMQVISAISSSSAR